ncbi:MAG TPA: hypothetical protein VFJ97_07915 [Dermatophilaceae bacterium]|nr:hypothetical protein [Dermatophilaceae bacterium]
MADQIEQALEQRLHMAEALLDAMAAAVSATSTTDVWRFASFKQFARKYNQIVEQVESIEHIEAPIDVFNMDAIPGSTDTIAMTQQELFESVRANLFILVAHLRNRTQPKAERITGIADFLQANLRRAVLSRPEREKDVQDVVEQLLIGRGMEKGLDYDRESGRVKVSVKEVIPDFVLPPLKTAIEVKIVKEGTTVGRMVDEINADIQAYQKAYDAIVFVVYDVAGALRDEAEFRRDLEATDGIRALLIKH